ncbi:uncharacterized protein LOC128956580 [Oppia nitens]|uniref:uncharacterized protein LOC128956580 n=1 Tax=Oppia nitens TaxID=1686743 RepID=UPI0023D9B263|nr:uncharacterized protein LOC128956580 [Oppia nitens]
MVSFCLTGDQQIYSWGFNGQGLLGRPTSVDDQYSKPSIIKYLSDKCITDIISGSQHTLALTSAGIVYGWGNNTYGQCGCGQQTDYMNGLVYSWGYHWWTDNHLVVKVLGSGSFGRVYKCLDNKTEELFAIKDIIITDNILKEVKQLLKLRSKFVVKCYDAWIESSKILYIQMELLSKSLKDLIELKPQTFHRKSNESMDFIEYYISSHLMLEMCECVEYLHTRQPPVIHRDLKPGNILINDKPLDNRFLKLCDFGLATDHLHKYMAPEVCDNYGSDRVAYNEKSDIYSMGCILLDLFDVNRDLDFR